MKDTRQITKERVYGNLHNEGGEGYNPYRIAPKPAKPDIDDRIYAIERKMGYISIHDPEWDRLEIELKSLKEKK